MIRLLARIFHADWRAPLTLDPTNHLAARERELLRQHTRQEDTAAGAPPRSIP